jgi:hypothetical protein
MHTHTYTLVRKTQIQQIATVKFKAIPTQAGTGPEGYKKLRLLEF